MRSSPYAAFRKVVPFGAEPCAAYWDWMLWRKIRLICYIVKSVFIHALSVRRITFVNRSFQDECRLISIIKCDVALVFWFCFSIFQSFILQQLSVKCNYFNPKIKNIEIVCVEKMKWFHWNLYSIPIDKKFIHSNGITKAVRCDCVCWILFRRIHFFHCYCNLL